MKRRTKHGRPVAQMARGTLATCKWETLPQTPFRLRPLGVQGHSRVVLIDRDGPRSYGEFAHHSRDALRELDVYLDSLDAANELPDGSLPRAA